MPSQDFAATFQGAPLKEIRERFTLIEAPSLERAAGTWNGIFIGPGWLMRLSPYGLALTGFKGWCGKTLRVEDDSANRIRQGAEIIERLPMRMTLGESILDGKPAVQLHYPPTTPYPWNHCVDELRELDENHLLGMVTIQLPVARRLPSPFLLQRER